jgi:hypothetical protein
MSARAVAVIQPAQSTISRFPFLPILSGQASCTLIGTNLPKFWSSRPFGHKSVPGVVQCCPVRIHDGEPRLRALNSLILMRLIAIQPAVDSNWARSNTKSQPDTAWRALPL